MLDDEDMTEDAEAFVAGQDEPTRPFEDAMEEITKLAADAERKCGANPPAVQLAFDWLDLERLWEQGKAPDAEPPPWSG